MKNCQIAKVKPGDEQAKEKLIAELTDCKECPEKTIAAIKELAEEMTVMRLLVAKRKIDPTLTAGKMAFRYGVSKGRCRKAVRLANRIKLERG